MDIIDKQITHNYLNESQIKYRTLFESASDTIIILNYHTILTDGERDYDLSLSLGTAHCEPMSKCSLLELIDQADMLLYEQKKKKYLVLNKTINKIDS